MIITLVTSCQTDLPHCSKLMETLGAIRQPKLIYFVAKRCLDFHGFRVYNLKFKLGSCLQSIRRGHSWALKNESQDSSDSSETQIMCIQGILDVLGKQDCSISSD